MNIMEVEQALKYLNTTATNNPNNQITSTPPPNAPTATDATSVSYNKSQLTEFCIRSNKVLSRCIYERC